MDFQLDRKIFRILQVLMENQQGLGFNQMAQLLKEDMSKVTLRKRLDELKKMGYVVHISRRQGQRHTYKINDKYISEVKRLLERSPQMDRPLRALEINIRLTPEYQEILKKRNPKLLEKVLEVHNDPVKRNELAQVLGSTYFTYIVSMIGKPSYTGTLLSDDRLLVIASTPPDRGKMVKKMLEYNLINDEVEAIQLLLNIGLEAIHNMLNAYERGELRGSRVSVSVSAFKLEEGKVSLIKDQSKIIKALKSTLC